MTDTTQHPDKNHPPRLPLAGVKVLDLSNLLAGPMTGMLLADFGADVIKVEHPKRGDEFRYWGEHKDGVPLYFKVLNRNKRTITLDLKHPKGQDIVKKLAARVDVIIENFRPGTLERWGIGWETLSAINPRLVMMRVTGFGQYGPYAQRPGFGSLAEGFSGYAYITGEPDRAPLLPSFGLGDGSAAFINAYAIMVALYWRDVNGGEGQYIDNSLYEGLFTLLGPQVINYDQLGIIQERTGSRHSFVAPRNTFKTKDGYWISVAGATQATFERICRALDIPEVIDDPRFADNTLRLKNADALEAKIQEAMLRFTFDEAMARFEQHEATVGPVYNIEQIFRDPHYQARENIIPVPDEELGTVKMQNVVPKFSKTPGRITHAGPPKGRYNREIYCGLLGLSEAELAELQAEGVI